MAADIIIILGPGHDSSPDLECVISRGRNKGLSIIKIGDGQTNLTLQDIQNTLNGQIAPHTKLLLQFHGTGTNEHFVALEKDKYTTKTSALFTAIRNAANNQAVQLHFLACKGGVACNDVTMQSLPVGSCVGFYSPATRNSEQEANREIMALLINRMAHDLQRKTTSLPKTLHSFFISAPFFENSFAFNSSNGTKTHTFQTVDIKQFIVLHDIRQIQTARLGTFANALGVSLPDLQQHQDSANVVDRTNGNLWMITVIDGLSSSNNAQNQHFKTYISSGNCPSLLDNCESCFVGSNFLKRAILYGNNDLISKAISGQAQGKIILCSDFHQRLFRA